MLHGSIHHSENSVGVPYERPAVERSNEELTGQGRTSGNLNGSSPGSAGSESTDHPGTDLHLHPEQTDP